jgi:hypothetical protein
MFKQALLATCLFAAIAAPAMAGTAVTLKHQPPDGAGIMFQLTDGTVLAQGGQGNDTWKLTPDNTGSYVNGTWTQLPNLPTGYEPYAQASAVLADGRVVFVGGEYNFGQFLLTNLCAIYDPVANTWTNLAPPKTWAYIGDSPSSVIPDGRYVVGRKLDKTVAALDPKTLTWTLLGNKGKKDFNAEEGWTLLPNGTILTYDVKKSPNSEIYDPIKQVWKSAGSTVANLMSPPAEKSIQYPGGVYHPPGEVGPGILRPDGTVFATGSLHAGAKAGHTAIYTPGANGAIGTWAAGPDFPNGDDAGDNFAVLLPTGNVLVQGSSGTLYEFNGTTLTASSVNGQGNSLMVLPTGEVLVGGEFVYRASGSVNPAWAPTITQSPATVTRGSTYKITGTQFNGLSQAAAFGDELETATNYPLVRITNTATGHVFYARTHDHSTMGVATGSTPVSTNFDVSSKTETGASTLVVEANGIPSTPVNVTVQ